MKITFIVFILSVSIPMMACQKEKQEQSAEAAAAMSGHKIVAEEVIQASSYTYIKAGEGDQSYWIAVTRREIKEGATLYYAKGMEMKNFTSKDLDRTFESIVFVDQISDKPLGMPGMAGAADPHSQAKSAAKMEISVAPAKGGISIGELYADKSSYDNRIVIISGKVTKFNAGIMGRNWAHIQDGSEADGKYDLTVTTNESVSVGDVVTFSGTIALDKDFGSGYKYEVIMENATVLK